MDTRLLRYYERELQHLREGGGEFARDYPKIAGRLGLEAFECADPYVERLLEGFSYLAARVQLKIDAEFPRFAEHLLELIYPDYLAPTPSMAVVQFQPNLAEASLAEGAALPRDTVLRSVLGKGEQTACEYRTAHPVTMFPLEIASASYRAYGGEYSGLDLSALGPVKSVLRLRLRATASLPLRALALKTLSLHLRGGDALPALLYEQIFGNAAGLLALPASGTGWHRILSKRVLRRAGFDQEQALLPTGPRSFQGYRLLQEYFSFPQRFMFVDIDGMEETAGRCDESEMDLVLLFDRLVPALEQGLDASNLALFCAPAVNLFPKRADRIAVTGQQSEYHVLPDRTRPMDYEVYRLQTVAGYGSGPEARQTFKPFYQADDLQAGERDAAYFQVRRGRRVLSERQRRQGPRSSYVGSEVFLSLVDSREAPHSADLRQLGIDLLCTNRDLPLSMPLGTGKTDFTLAVGAPVASIRCVAGPTAPVPSYAEGETAWRLVNHLSLNYLSLTDAGSGRGAEALRDLLRLYVGPHDIAAQRQIEGVRNIASAPVTRRLPGPGPIAYGRGLQIALSMDEGAFEGAGIFLLGGVLEQFFAKYVSLNAFTETVVLSTTRGKIMTWPARSGRCEIL